MKIKSSIGKNVTAAMANCREVLVQETINLLKLIGAESGQDVPLGKLLFLFQRKDNTAETIVFDRISYGPDECSERFYFVSMEGDVMCKSSTFLSIDSLMAIYEAVRKVVREN